MLVAYGVRAMAGALAAFLAVRERVRPTGKLAPGSVSPRAGRQAPGADRHGWLCGFAAAIPTVYPRDDISVAGCIRWQHPGESAEVRPCGSEEPEAQAIYLAEGRGKAETAFAVRRPLAAAVRRGGGRLEQDYRSCCRSLPSPDLWRKLRTTNVIERCFVSATENRLCVLCEVESVDRIIYSIFRDSIWNGKPHPQPIYTSC